MSERYDAGASPSGAARHPGSKQGLNLELVKKRFAAPLLIPTIVWGRRQPLRMVVDVEIDTFR
ncbi:hypothetical protein HC028_04600 [Planosporangium flavigriseum]|uniref:hypothetical protein n=1 Tax=Planosporangium flavigriseum TaxID=373681 RepID=UPI00143BF667|nr:hypothetical protein [Planosporangium flavigriseum]NJC63788.1 hypothetical protein [Planosporangium flavigriseum]